MMLSLSLFLHTYTSYLLATKPNDEFRAAGMMMVVVVRDEILGFSSNHSSEHAGRNEREKLHSNFGLSVGIDRDGRVWVCARLLVVAYVRDRFECQDYLK